VNLNRNVAAVPTITEATGTNAIATASKAAPDVAAGSTRRNYIQRVIVSASGAVAAATTLQLKSGATVLMTINLSTTSLNAPLDLDFKSHPLACAAGDAAVAVVGALGAAIICNVQLLTFAAD
jgi:hypothetical protein